jgi:hypothetical protein
MSLVPLQVRVGSGIVASPAKPDTKKRKRRLKTLLRAKIKRTRTRIRVASWASLALVRRKRRGSARKT